VITLALVWSRQFGPARLTSALAVGAIIVGLAVAQSPDFLPGELTLRQAAASNDTLAVLLVVVVIIAALLIPALTYLFRLVLRGTLDTEFHPIVAADKGKEDER
jgi:cytochrome bd ubiquinol oxidase subunit II